MKIILWIHRERLEDLHKCIVDWVNYSEPGEPSPLHLSVSQVGHHWVQIILDYSTYIGLLDNEAIKII
jgi:hypothetical protein